MKCNECLITKRLLCVLDIRTRIIKSKERPREALERTIGCCMGNWNGCIRKGKGCNDENFCEIISMAGDAVAILEEI